jgi:hypothetical protein
MIKPCENCGKPTKNRHSLAFCGHGCQFDYQYKMYIAGWINGVNSGRSGKLGMSEHIRRFLYEKYDSKCSVCGWNKINTTTGKIPLEIEHIDGNYENCSEANLTLLCPNCHSLTPTFRALNKGHGRKARS